MLKSSLQNKILKTLPDDRPITSIQIVENLEKCPRGFYPINKTYDQDQDADLRENTYFKSGNSRYLCLSKTEGLPNFVVQEVLVLNEKINPPKGYSLLSRTADSEQKAWKKKQLCYRLVNLKDAGTAVTDIILCSKQKKSPEGFSCAGELNGLTISYKMGNVQDSQSNNGNSNFPQRLPAVSPLSPSGGNVYPSLNNGGDHDYEILRPGYPPTRPAPKPPVPAPLPHQNSTHTLGNSHQGLDGVPFIINPKFVNSSTADKFPVIKAKSMQQIIKEYDYPFTVERQT